MNKICKTLTVGLFLLGLLLISPSQANDNLLLKINGVTVTGGTSFLDNYTPKPSVVKLEITIAVETSGVFIVNWSGKDLNMNSGVALVIDDLNTFDIDVNGNANYDFEMDTTTVLYITINEVHKR